MGNINPSKKFWYKRSVLVTGGAGFIGSWLSHDILKLGARVVILDIKDKLPSLGRPLDAVLEQGTFVQGDVRDESILKSVYSKYNIQTIFHLAAETIVDEAIANPSQALDTNIRGTWQVLETFRSICGTNGQIVVASSDKAYGSNESLPYKEDDALLGEHPYDCSKSCADRIAYMYAKVYGVPVCITRCGNVFGGGDFHFSRLIPGAIKSFFFEKPFEIRSDGLYRRDYIYIKDVVLAYMRTAEMMVQKNIVGEAFNFGSNLPTSAIDVVNCIAANMQKSHIKPVILATAQHEIKDQYLDVSKARRFLGWVPGYSFEDGMRETIEWYTDFFKVYGEQN